MRVNLKAFVCDIIHHGNVLSLSFEVPSSGWRVSFSFEPVWAFTGVSRGWALPPHLVAPLFWNRLFCSGRERAKLDKEKTLNAEKAAEGFEEEERRNEG